MATTGGCKAQAKTLGRVSPAPTTARGCDPAQLGHDVIRRVVPSSLGRRQRRGGRRWRGVLHAKGRTWELSTEIGSTELDPAVRATATSSRKKKGSAGLRWCSKGRGKSRGLKSKEIGKKLEARV